MKVAIVTGSVASGKTTLAKALSKKLNYKYIDVHNLIKKNKLYDSYDRNDKCYVVDVKKLNKFLIKEINQYKRIIKKESRKIKNFPNSKFKNFEPLKKKKKEKTKKKSIKGIIIDSHLSHYLARRYVDLCIVTKCELKELQKRLKKKGYSKNKIRENLDCEIFDICLNEAREKGHKVIIIDTTKRVNTKEIRKRFK